MHQELQNLRHDYFHRISWGPDEKSHLFNGQRSDIVLHLPVLEYYGSLCSYIVEFGVRDAHSTVAFLGGCKGMVFSYDIERTPIVEKLLKCTNRSQWAFFVIDTGDPEYSNDVPLNPDAIFFDTLHTYEHLTKELSIYGRRAKKFLMFHDTYTCGQKDRTGANPNEKGIVPAIEEFVGKYPTEYKTAYRTNWSNGLWILERKGVLSC